MSAVYLAFLAAFIAIRAPASPEEMQRYQTTAAAAEIVHMELLPRWQRSARQLMAAMVTIVDFESDMLLKVHDGSIRGKAGEICLAQIHRANGLWKRHAAKFEDLAGVTLGHTVQCFRTMADTLVHSLNLALKHRYLTYWREATFSAYHVSKPWKSPERWKRARAMRAWELSLSV